MEGIVWAYPLLVSQRVLDSCFREGGKNTPTVNKSNKSVKFFLLPAAEGAQTQWELLQGHLTPL